MLADFNKAGVAVADVHLTIFVAYFSADNGGRVVNRCLLVHTLCNCWKCKICINQPSCFFLNMHIYIYILYYYYYYFSLVQLTHECTMAGIVLSDQVRVLRMSASESVAYNAEERGCGIWGAGFASFSVWLEQGEQEKGGEWKSLHWICDKTRQKKGQREKNWSRNVPAVDGSSQRSCFECWSLPIHPSSQCWWYVSGHQSREYTPTEKWWCLY